MASQRSINNAVHLGKTLAGYSQWAAPAALTVGWLAWPALSDNFKTETLGLPEAKAPTPPNAGGSSNQNVFKGTGKYNYVRSEIGEAPTLEGGDDDDE